MKEKVHLIIELKIYFFYIILETNSKNIMKRCFYFSTPCLIFDLLIYNRI